MSSMVPCRKPNDMYRLIRDGLPGRMVSRARRCRSMHDSTPSKSRQCFAPQDKLQRHSRARLSRYRVRGLRWCSLGLWFWTLDLRWQYPINLSFCKDQKTKSYDRDNNFFSLRWLILPCSAAAIGNSVGRSFSILVRKAESISSEDFPAAQIIKMNPNLSS